MSDLAEQSTSDSPSPPAVPQRSVHTNRAGWPSRLIPASDRDTERGVAADQEVPPMTDPTPDELFGEAITGSLPESSLAEFSTALSGHPAAEPSPERRYADDLRQILDDAKQQGAQQ